MLLSKVELENAVMYSFPAKSIDLIAYAHENKLVLEVRDEGEGIPVAYQQQVFGMYVKASESSTGNGLRLYVVSRLVKELRGELELESSPGKGSCIKVNLPLL